MEVISDGIGSGLAHIFMGDGHRASVDENGDIGIEVEGFLEVYFTAQELNEVSEFAKKFRDRRIAYKAKHQNE